MWNLERMRGAGQILELFWGRCHRGFAFGTVRGDLGRIRAVSVPGASLGNLSKLRFSFLSSLNFVFFKLKIPFWWNFSIRGRGRRGFQGDSQGLVPFKVLGPTLKGEPRILTDFPQIWCRGFAAFLLDFSLGFRLRSRPGI